MNGHLHIAPVLQLPHGDISADDVSLTVNATHRVLAPHRPVVRKAVASDIFAIAGLRSSVFGWVVDLSFEKTVRPLTFQLNWMVQIEARQRQCQHRLTVTLEDNKHIKEPLWSTDASLWRDAAGKSSSIKLTPVSVFSRAHLNDEMQREIAITMRPRITTIVETLAIPAMERGQLAECMAERYGARKGAAA